MMVVRLVFTLRILEMMVRLLRFIVMMVWCVGILRLWIYDRKGRSGVGVLVLRGVLILFIVILMLII